MNLYTAGELAEIFANKSERFQGSMRALGAADEGTALRFRQRSENMEEFKLFVKEEILTGENSCFGTSLNFLSQYFMLGVRPRAPTPPPFLPNPA